MDIKKNILTEEEAATLVTWGNLSTTLEMITESIIEGEEKIVASTGNLITILSDRIMQLEYECVRDRHFFIDVLSNIKHLNMCDIKEMHKAYCEEFDQLNKKE